MLHRINKKYHFVGSKVDLGSFGVKGAKQSFLPKSITRPCYIAWSKGSYVCISLRPSTYVMVSQVNLGSLGSTGNFHQKMFNLLSLTPWPFKPLPGLFCLNIFIGCAQKKGWYNKPRIFSLPVSPYFQSLQLPPTWDGRRWVKRFGPEDPHTPAALLSALQVSSLTPNFQTSYYFLPTRWYRWLLGLFLRFRLSPAVFLCLIGPGT